MGNFLSSNENIMKIITKSKYIHSLSYLNIYFFWLSDNPNKDLQNSNYLLSLDMFKISLCLNQYKFNPIDTDTDTDTDTISRYIIWIPINAKRDFKYNSISEINLKRTEKNFEAFVASGVTFGTNPKITIITRYEEIEKLLIHELIHNYNMDGSGFHDELTRIVEKYKIVKNNSSKLSKSSKSSKLNYHYEYSIYESYTELLSTYFYLLFSNIKSKIKINQKKLIGQILIELIYSYNLVANLINLNEYANYNEFKLNKIFVGNICKYEYYYIKALMYNNFILKFGNNLKDFIDIYTSLIDMIIRIQNTDDILMETIYSNFIIQTNYKYQIH